MDRKTINRGTICWLHFHNQGKVGHQDAGEYAYIKGYAKNHSKKIEDEELYVKIAIKDIFWLHGHCRFVFEIMCKDGSLVYQKTVDGADRLTVIEWKHPTTLKWSIPTNF